MSDCGGTLRPRRGLTRRKRRQRRERQRILNAAAPLFASQGYAATTTREIAAAADIAEGTLYNYFDSKRALLLAVARETEGPMEVALLEGEGMAPRAAMIAMLEKAFDISGDQLPFLRTLLSEAWVDDGILQDFLITRLGRLQERLQAFITYQIEAGHFRPVDSALSARLAIAMFGGLLLPILRGMEPIPSPPERRSMAEAMADFILDGVRRRDG